MLVGAALERPWSSPWSAPLSSPWSSASGVREELGEASGLCDSEVSLGSGSGEEVETLSEGDSAGSLDSDSVGSGESLVCDGETVTSAGVSGAVGTWPVAKAAVVPMNRTAAATGSASLSFMVVPLRSWSAAAWGCLYCRH